MRCALCKKEHPLSLWDKIRLFFFSFFKEDIQDLSDDKFTKGFGEGYVMGYKRAKEDIKPI